jgi:hypothetical protein
MGRPCAAASGRRRCFPHALAAGALILTVLLFPICADAHDFTITVTTASFRADGTFQIDMACNLDALVLGVGSGQHSAELAGQVRQMPPAEFDAAVQRLRELFIKRTRIRFDGGDVEPTVEFPEYSATPSEHTELPSCLGVTARLTGRVPESARFFTFWASRAFQAVHLTILREDINIEIKHILSVAEESPPYPLREAPAVPPSRLSVALEYVRLGYEHILPKGVDHILFVLGLFLLNTNWRSLLMQITSFTLAHSLTLALSMYGVVRLSPSIVEPLIALSIAVVAIENLATSKLHVWRTAIVFAFGLLHGLGFAGVLTELGLPRSEFVTALVGFNIGVELGQLSVIALAFLLIGWWRQRLWYRPRITIPISAIIAALGLYAAVQRAFLPDLPSPL